MDEAYYCIAIRYIATQSSSTGYPFQVILVNYSCICRTQCSDGNKSSFHIFLIKRMTPTDAAVGVAIIPVKGNKN